MNEQIKNNKIIEKLELPKDVIFKEADIHLFGNEEIMIVNHRGLNFYELDKAIVLTDHGQIVINGRGLFIPRFDTELLSIKGIITGIEFRSC